MQYYKVEKGGMYPTASKLYEQSSSRVILVKTIDKAKINSWVKALEVAKVLVYSKKRLKIYFLYLGNKNLLIK
jgi:DNA repair protein RadC